MLLEKMRSTVETDKIRARFDSVLTESRQLPIESKIASPRYQYDSMISMFDEFVATGRVGGTVKSTDFETGDMVWVKVKSYPWWPGQILSELFASASVLASKKDGLVLVAFFGDSSYGWFCKDDLVPFDANFDEKLQQAQSKSFVKAVKDAIDEFCKRSALGLTCRCRNPNNFRLIDVEGYLAVDISDYEPGSVYSTRQIEKARENFNPKEVRDFIKQLAVLPRNIRHESLDFFEKKATVLAYRKAVFEEFDSTYDQAFDDESNNHPVENAQEAATIIDASGSGRSSEFPAINPPNHGKSPGRPENNTKLDQEENTKKLTNPYKLSKRNKKVVMCGSSETLVQENKEKRTKDVANKKMEEVKEKLKTGKTEENKKKHTEDLTNKKVEEVQEKQKRGKTEENKEKHNEDVTNKKTEEAKENQKRGKTEENKEKHTKDVTNKKMEEVKEKQKRGKTEETKEKHTEDLTNKKMEEVEEKHKRGKTEENKEKNNEDVTNKKMEDIKENQKRGKAEENKEKHTKDVANKKVEEVKERQKTGKTEENKEKHTEDLTNKKMEEVKEKQKRGKTEENKEKHTKDVTNKKMEEVKEKQKRGKTEENKEKHNEDVANKKMEEVEENQKRGKTEENKEKHTVDLTNKKMEEVKEIQKRGKTEGNKVKHNEDVTKKKMEEVKENQKRCKTEENKEKHNKDVTNKKMEEVKEKQKMGKLEENKEKHYEDLKKMEEVKEKQKRGKTEENKEKHCKDVTNKKMEEVKENQKRGNSEENKEKYNEDLTNKKTEEVNERGKTEDNKEKHNEDVTNKKMEEVKENQKRGKTEENKEKHTEDVTNKKMEEVREKQKKGKTEGLQIKEKKRTSHIVDEGLSSSHGIKTRSQKKLKASQTTEGFKSPEMQTNISVSQPEMEIPRTQVELEPVSASQPESQPINGNKEKHNEDVTNKKMEEVKENQKWGKTEENKEKHSEDVTNKKMEEVREKQKKGKTECSPKKEKKRTSHIVNEGSSQGVKTRSQKKLKAQSQTTEGFESSEMQPNISVSQPEMEIPRTQVELEPVSASQPESQPINGSKNPPKMTFVEQYFYFMRIGNR